MIHTRLPAGACRWALTRVDRRASRLVPAAPIPRPIKRKDGTAAAIPIGYPVRGGHGPIARRAPEKLAFADTWGEPLFGGIAS